MCHNLLQLFFLVIIMGDDCEMFLPGKYLYLEKTNVWPQGYLLFGRHLNTFLLLCKASSKEENLQIFSLLLSSLNRRTKIGHGNDFYAPATLNLSVVVFAVVINASIIVKIFKWQFKQKDFHLFSVITGANKPETTLNLLAFTVVCILSRHTSDRRFGFIH